MNYDLVNLVLDPCAVDWSITWPFYVFDDPPSVQELPLIGGDDGKEYGCHLVELFYPDFLL